MKKAEEFYEEEDENFEMLSPEFCFKMMNEFAKHIIDEVANKFEDRHNEEVADEIRMYKKQLK